MNTLPQETTWYYYITFGQFCQWILHLIYKNMMRGVLSQLTGAIFFLLDVLLKMETAGHYRRFLGLYAIMFADTGV
jgi:hypothetical protein